MDGDEPIEEPLTWRRAPVLLSDRLGLRPSGLVFGLLAVLAAGAGAWWALETPTPPAEDVLPLVQDVAPPVVATVPPPSRVLVHVDGAVRFPGVHELTEGARVTDAIDAAGGLTPNADRRQLNLAQVVGDGQRVWVPVEGETTPVVAGAGPESEGAPSGGGIVSLSTGSVAALDDLPGIGPSLAAAIVDHREREGPFESVDDLLSVAGIGPAKLDALRDLVVP